MAAPLTTAQSLHALGLTTSLIYAGFSFGASYLTVPLLYPLPARHAASFFDGFFHEGAGAMVPTALLSTTALAAGSYFLSTESRPRAASFYGWHSATLGYVAALVVIAGMPWTAAVMMPTNNRLIELGRDAGAADRAAAEVVQLLRSWRWMNFVRAGCGFFGGVLGLAALLGQR